MKYTGADNAEHRPVVIHRAIFGSLERFIGILVEHFAGAFPLWLSPVQAIVLPIADRHLDYAREVVEILTKAGLKADLDDRQEKVNYKIARRQLQKIPYMLGWGIAKRTERAVAVRSRAKGDVAPHAGSVRGRRACRGPDQSVILVVFVAGGHVSHSIEHARPVVTTVFASTSEFASEKFE